MLDRRVFARGVADLMDPDDLYEQLGEVVLIHGRVVTLSEAVEMFDVSPLIKRFGSWAVTEYGVECLSTHYAIPKDRLNEPDWLEHMGGKSDRDHGGGWGVYEDIRDALAYAGRRVIRPPKPESVTRPDRERHRRRVKLSNRIRFLVMKRDNYRCQLCGIGANEGVQLDIDHKVSLARGGSNLIENLWVLCHPCNNGKRTDDL